MGDAYYSGDRASRNSAEGRSDRLKLYLGHAGWSPGQLQGEILRGSWTLVRADAFTVFQKSPDAIWPELARSEVTVAAADREGQSFSAVYPAPCIFHSRRSSSRAREPELHRLTGLF
jgi:hypothetical protein